MQLSKLCCKIDVKTKQILCEMTGLFRVHEYIFKDCFHDEVTGVCCMDLPLILFILKMFVYNFIFNKISLLFHLPPLFNCSYPHPYNFIF